MRLSLSLLVTLLLAMASVSSCTESQPVITHLPTTRKPSTLELGLKLDKDVYNSGEAIYATLVLKNTGAESVLVNARMAANFPLAPEPLRDVVFMITGPTGEEILFGARVQVLLIKPDDFVILDPGETIEQEYEIRNLYLFRETGAHSIRAIYQNQSDTGDGRVAWKGEIRSNEVSFTLEP